MPISVRDTGTPPGPTSAFTIIQPDTGTSPTAAGTADTLTITSSDGAIGVDGDASTDTIDLTLATPPNSFGTIAVPSGTNPVADQNNDTLTLSSNHSGLTISGLASADSVIYSLVEGQIDHDQLLNFDANEHFLESAINHVNIQGIGTNSHTQIDSHIADATIHYAESAISHVNIQGIGTNSHTQIDSHISDSTIHFEESAINHVNIQGIGTNSHTQIDAHIANTSNPHSVTFVQLSGVLAIGQGGTNSSAALSNGLVMMSSASKIVESAIPIADLTTLTDGSNADALHDHNMSAISGTVDISTQTNLTVSLPITLTGDTVGFSYSQSNTWTSLNVFNDTVQIPFSSAGTSISASGRITIDTGQGTFNFHDGTAERVLSPIKSKAIIVEDPTASEDLSMFYADEAVTVSKMTCVLTGSNSQSITWTVRHSTNRDATGNEIVTGGTTTTSLSAGSVVTVFNDPTIPSDSFVWLETTSQVGTVDSLNLTIFYRQDP